MEIVFKALQVLILLACGATIGIGALALVWNRREDEYFSKLEDEVDEQISDVIEKYENIESIVFNETRFVRADTYAPYAEFLAKPCWVKEGKGSRARWEKYRVVAVSHRGSLNVRPWDATNGAFWIGKDNVDERVSFEEVPE